MRVARQVLDARNEGNFFFGCSSSQQKQTGGAQAIELGPRDNQCPAILLGLELSKWCIIEHYEWKDVFSSDGDSGILGKIRVLICKSRTYDLPITSSDALPLSYRG